MPKAGKRAKSIQFADVDYRNFESRSDRQAGKSAKSRQKCQKPANVQKNWQFIHDKSVKHTKNLLFVASFSSKLSTDKPLNTGES